MSDRYPEGVILCHTHGRPFGECRHPQLTGEVADASKPVDPRQRLQSAHMRSFVEREPINADPTNGGLRGEGAPDEWQRRNAISAFPTQTWNPLVIRMVSSPRAREAQERQVERGGVDTAWTGRPDPVRVVQERLRDARAEFLTVLEHRALLLATAGLEAAIDATCEPEDTAKEGLYHAMARVIRADEDRRLEERLIADIRRELGELHLRPVVTDIAASGVVPPCAHCEEVARLALASMRESISVLGGEVVIDMFTMPKPTLRGRLRRWWLDRVVYPLDDLRERVGERLETWPYGSILTQVTAAWYSREAASLPYAETYDVWWEGGPIARVWAPALHAALHLTHPLEAGDTFTFNGWRLRVLAIYETYYAYRVVPSWLYHPARAFLGLGRLDERAKRLAYRAGLLHPRVNEELRWSQFRRPEER